MIKETKAFSAESAVELMEIVNNWIEDNDNKKIVDVKFVVSEKEAKSFVAYLLIGE